MTLKLEIMRGDIARIASDAAIVNLFDGVKTPEGATGAVDIAASTTTIVHGAGIGGIETSDAAQALAEGSIVGTYGFNKYKKSSNNRGSRLETLNIVEFDDSKIPDVRSGMGSGVTAGEAQNFARDLVNEPANVLSPELMKKEAGRISEDHGLGVYR